MFSLTRNFMRNSIILVIVISLLGISFVCAAQKLSEEFEFTEERIAHLQQQSAKLETGIKHQKQKFAGEIEKALVRRVIRDYNTGFTAGEEEELVNTIVLVSKEHQLNPLMITAIIETESHFNNYARSYMGARGLMQVMPVTGREIAKEIGLPWRGTKTLHDPSANVRIGTYYFASLLKRFKSPNRALIAYNQGPTNLSYRLQKGYRLPQRYWRKVMRAFDKHTQQLPLFA